MIEEERCGKAIAARISLNPTVNRDPRENVNGGMTTRLHKSTVPGTDIFADRSATNGSCYSIFAGENDGDINQYTQCRVDTKAAKPY